MVNLGKVHKRRNIFEIEMHMPYPAVKCGLVNFKIIHPKFVQFRLRAEQFRPTHFSVQKVVPFLQNPLSPRVSEIVNGFCSEDERGRTSRPCSALNFFFIIFRRL